MRFAVRFAVAAWSFAVFLFYLPRDLLRACATGVPSGQHYCQVVSFMSFRFALAAAVLVAARMLAVLAGSAGHTGSTARKPWHRHREGCLVILSIFEQFLRPRREIALVVSARPVSADAVDNFLAAACIDHMGTN